MNNFKEYMMEVYNKFCRNLILEVNTGLVINGKTTLGKSAIYDKKYITKIEEILPHIKDKYFRKK